MKSEIIYNYEDYKTLYNHLQWDYIPWLNARKHLDFSDLNELIKSFKYNRRREIRLSLNAGLSYYETFNLKDIKGFYEILKTTYRKKIGLPLPVYSFSMNLLTQD